MVPDNPGMTHIKSYQASIDALKGVAIIGVVAMHLPRGGGVGGQDREIVVLVQLLMEWCVLGFFFAAGFLQGSKAGKFNFKSWGRFTLVRVWRLLIPCLAFSIFNKGVLYVLWSHGLVRLLPYEKPVSLLTSAKFLFDPCAPQFYFLPVLFCVQVAGFPIMHGLKSTAFYIAVGTFLLNLFIWTPVADAMPLHGFHPQLYLFYFSVYLLGFYMVKSGDRFPSLKNPCIAACALGLVFLCLIGPYGWKLIFFMVPPCVNGFFHFFANSRITRFFSKLGRQSAGIFVWHAPIVISGVAMVFSSFLGQGAISSFTALVVSIVLSAACAALIRRMRFLGPLRY